MLVKETERTKCSLSESLTSKAIAQHDQARCYRAVQWPFSSEVLICICVGHSMSGGLSRFFACGIRFAFLLWSLPCFKWNVLILKSHAPLWNQRKFIKKKNAHTLSLIWEIRHVFVCLWKNVLNQKNKQATRYSHSMWFVLNTQWKLDVSSDKEVHKLILVWNHKRATLWSLLILKLKKKNNILSFLVLMSSIIALTLSIVFKCMKQSIGSNLKVLTLSGSN